KLLTAAPLLVQSRTPGAPLVSPYCRVNWYNPLEGATAVKVVFAGGVGPGWLTTRPIPWMNRVSPSSWVITKLLLPEFKNTWPVKRKKVSSMEAVGRKVAEVLKKTG